jgi:hypothetical protein
MTEIADESALPRAEPTTIVPHLTMRHLVLDIRKDFQRTAEAHGKFKAERLRLARDLFEARARVEGGEEGDIDWWVWFEKTFTQSRSDAERLLAIAAAENPEGAYAAAKEKNAAYNQAYRERQRQASISREMDGPAPVETRVSVDGRQVTGRVEPPAPERQDIIDQIKSLFLQLSRTDRRHCAAQLNRIWNLQ